MHARGKIGKEVGEIFDAASPLKDYFFVRARDSGVSFRLHKGNGDVWDVFYPCKCFDSYVLKKEHAFKVKTIPEFGNEELEISHVSGEPTAMFGEAKVGVQQVKASVLSPLPGHGDVEGTKEVFERWYKAGDMVAVETEMSRVEAADIRQRRLEEIGNPEPPRKYKLPLKGDSGSIPFSKLQGILGLVKSPSDPVKVGIEKGYGGLRVSAKIMGKADLVALVGAGLRPGT